ncbi:MAG: HAMP domain-containing sensor histidine kinase [Ferruginibacter sp.]
MQFKKLQPGFLRDNLYLLLLSLLLLSISVFTNSSGNPRVAEKAFASRIENYIQNGRDDFNTLVADSPLIQKIFSASQSEKETSDLHTRSNFLFFYKITEGYTELSFWNTQAVLPNEALISAATATGLTRLSNGYYFFQKQRAPGRMIIGLLPVKWDFVITNNYLINDFAADLGEGSAFAINTKGFGTPVKLKEGRPLFNLNYTGTAGGTYPNLLTVWLRILSLIPLMLFIYFAASYIRLKKGLAHATLFLAGSLFFLRVMSYLFAFPVSLRRFELFDPAVYGSGSVLRSLGDLLINAVLFFWIINFINSHLKGLKTTVGNFSPVKKILLFATGVFILLFVTYTGSSVIRSMVADSQISFDVINFFSLNLYSVIGFIVLCCIAVGYYYFCRIILFFLKELFPGTMLTFFLSVAVAGLVLLSFRVGNLSGGFELYVLLWLLLFLLLIINDLSGFFSSGLIISRTVFWLFFFSASIAVVLITENSRKELRSRLHYAELIASKNNALNEILLNTMLTEFRPDRLAEKFELFAGVHTAGPFRDSLINNNLSGYADKYDIKVLAYDSLLNPLNNADSLSYNSINSIYKTQARTTSVEGLYYYDAGYDKFSYLSRNPIRNFAGTLLGYVFIIISPKNSAADMFYPELFSKGDDNAIENSSEYSFAIYEKGKLVKSDNEYGFPAIYIEKYFAGRDFLAVNKNRYSELWYNAGSDKYVVIVKENRVMIEMITLFSYLFCSFLLLSTLFWIVSTLLRSRLKFSRLRNELQFTIREQVHGTVILFSALSFIVIGVATILFFISRYENNNKETLSRTIRIMEKDLTESVTPDLIQRTVFQNAESSVPGELEIKVKRLSEVHGPDVNLYSLTGDLKASSLPLPYVKGIVSTKNDPIAYYHLYRGKEIQYFQREHIGGLSFVSAYLTVNDRYGNAIAYLNIPYFTSQTRLKEEISNFLVTIINLNAFIFLIAGMVALIITNRITRSFSFISEKMKKINLGTHNEIIWNRNDEIGALVKEYNRMLAKLEESAAALAKTERESAWQEMARQVAHEIKNPLTPMRLGMQFLQKAIESGAPDIKQLGAKVSATLVEQIDHLSMIAGEFSRFANIEKANPEIFDINEALRSVKQLYEMDPGVDFTWKLLPNPIMIDADKTHVNRILTNLILNGIQSVSPVKRPHILTEEKLIGGMVEITIEDNGTGISDAAQEKLFTPNFTTKSSGTGLGLAMCRRMAEQAGGSIRYETSERGTCFYVLLPVIMP